MYFLFSTGIVNFYEGESWFIWDYRMSNEFGICEVSESLEILGKLNSKYRNICSILSDTDFSFFEIH